MHTPAADREAISPLELLVRTVSSDGGWGYRADQPAHLEPTCFGVLALDGDSDARPPHTAAERGPGGVVSPRDTESTPKATRQTSPPNPLSEAERGNRKNAALAALEQHAAGDGSYRLARGRPQAVWPTALVLFTKARLNRPAAELKPIIDKLLAIEGKVVRLETSDAGDIDAGLLGWPWASDTFSWVEPTAWACLALRAAGQGEHPRVQEGLRLLLDRAFDHGGANYGSRIILGKQTEAIPGPTAILLLALQGVKDQPRIDAAKGYLRVTAGQTTDVENLAWIKLALSCHADDSATRDALPMIDERLRGALAEETGRSFRAGSVSDGPFSSPQSFDKLDRAPSLTLPALKDAQSDGLGAGPMRLALAALALNTSAHNPFQLTDTPTVATHAIVGSTRASAKDQAAPASSDATGFFGKLRSKMRGFVINGTAAMRPLPVTSAVHIAKAESYDSPIADILRTQFEHFRQHVPVAGKRIVLKPNLVEFSRGKVINTDPRFVDGVIEFFKREGAAEVIVAEGPGHWRNVQYLVNASGLGDVLRKHGVRFVDINHDEPVKTLNLGRTTGLEYLYLSRTVLDADVFVSLPKLKTHHWAGATLSLKNLFGSLPGICYGWPKNELHWRGIPNSIVDIALTHMPHLAIIDGIVGMEGDGPLAGSAKPVGAIVMGIDLLAVDATGCRLMMMPPERLPTLRLAEQKRVGHLKAEAIPQLGESIESLAQSFEMPPEIEKQLIAVGK